MLSARTRHARVWKRKASTLLQVRVGSKQEDKPARMLQYLRVVLRKCTPACVACRQVRRGVVIYRYAAKRVTRRVEVSFCYVRIRLCLRV